MRNSVSEMKNLTMILTATSCPGFEVSRLFHDAPRALANKLLDLVLLVNLRFLHTL